MIKFNSNGMSFLTVADRKTISEGKDPGDDGTGRRFKILDDTRLVCVVPTEIEPIECGYLCADDPFEPAEVVVTDDAADWEAERAELRAQIAEHAETIDRIMAQRDEALAKLARATNDEDLIGTPDPD
jgi:hypothetical protein